MYCPRSTQTDVNKCIYGFETSIVCNKNRCLQGPDEECDDQSPFGKHCADGLRCSCGFCQGCFRNICAARTCGKQAKRAPSKPLWLAEVYRQQDEKRRLQELQQDEQRQHLSPRDFINVKSMLDRVSYYPFNNSAELIFNN